MTLTAPPPSLEDFVKRVVSAASELGMEATARPDLLDRSFNGTFSQSTTLNPADLPAEAYAMVVGRYTVIFGILPEAPSLVAVRETLRKYRNQCVVARSYLSPNQSLDLQLMLVGPRGSERVKKWTFLGLFVERDDRVARKLAWLRPEDEMRDADSFPDFLKRTFLARPWREDRTELSEGQSLDLVDPETAGLPRSTAEEFDRIALQVDEDTPSDDIVEQLVRAWERREKA
ncbi:ABC-three component system middle component 1 [Rhizobium ruizarguesonis]|nr:ABC-three component system middle component 1 [Rhizobium ruizarguesonis]